MIRGGVKGSRIRDKTYKFDGDKIKYKFEYEGKGKSSQPDKLRKQNFFLLIYLYKKYFQRHYS